MKHLGSTKEAGPRARQKSPRQLRMVKTFAVTVTTSYVYLSYGETA